MGRPLKIKKSATVDIGFNNFGSLTDPVAPANTWISTDYIGVVGGSDEGGITSITIINGGANYSLGLTSTASTPELEGGVTALLSPIVNTPNGNITGFTITNGGSGYVDNPVISLVKPANVSTAASGNIGNANIITVATSGIFVGEFATGTNVAAGTKVVAVTGNLVQLSAEPTGNLTANIVFSDGGTGANVSSVMGFPTVAVRVYVPGDTQENPGFIIRQKGQSKFLVAAANAIQDENIVAGNSYFVTNAGTTNWIALGGSSTLTTQDIFTATANGTGTGNGVVYLVGQCVLADVNNGALTEGDMTVTITLADASTERLSRLTNKWGLDFQTPPASPSDENPSINDQRYLLNFFEASNGVAVKSGIEGDTATGGYGNTVPLVVVNNTNT